METLGSLKARVLRELKEDEDPELIKDKLNDAIESLWESILLVNLSYFTAGPISTLSFAPGSERCTLISVSDPVAPPVLQGVVVVNNLPDGRTTYLKYTLVTESGSETLPSPTGNITLNHNQAATIGPVPTPAESELKNVIGYNVYGSYNLNGRFAKQNVGDPIRLDATWSEPNVGITMAPDLPSPPSVNSTGDDIYFIKVLEIQNPDQTYTKWQGSDIDALLMARASRNISAATTYQSYAYDLLNGNTVEIRPASGMQLNPRHFYVKKPRRLRFDSSPSPFSQFSSTEYLINFAVSRLKLNVDEYQAHLLWEGLAKDKKTSIMQSVNQQQELKQKFITPFIR